MLLILTPSQERVHPDSVLVPHDGLGRVGGVLGLAREVDVAALLHEDVPVAHDPGVGDWKRVNNERVN